MRWSKQALLVLATFTGSGAYAAVPTEFVYVNGGYSPETNYSVHEQDLLAFRNGLFAVSPATSVHLLNAGGEGTKVIKTSPDGTYERTEEGQMVILPSQVTEPTESATYDHTVRLFDRLKSAKPARLTIVYGDHGGPLGIALWDGRNLSAKDLRESYQKLPSSTLIRAIHLHCFGGSAMVDPGRKIPESPESLKGFFAFHYPLNRCAAAMSHEDEVGQYYSWDKSWDQGPWVELLKAHPHLTLKELKDVFNADRELAPSPVLTSDYLLRDLSAYFCADIRKEEDAFHVVPLPDMPLSCSNSDSIVPRSIESVHHRMKNELCVRIRSVAKKINGPTELMSRYDKISSQFEEIRAFWKHRYLSGLNPNLIKSYEASKKKIDVLRAKIGTGALAGKEKSRVLNEISELNKFYAVQYSLASKSLDRNPAFEQYFDLFCTAEWLDSQKAKYLEFATYRLANMNQPRNYTSVDLNSWSQIFKREAQKSKKLLYEELYRERREVAEELLLEPEFRKIKEVYENIKSCENTPLD
jgi:hypothetical protein